MQGTDEDNDATMSVHSAKPWNACVFGVNHLYFWTLSYFEFPLCLALCSVHRTWRERLWPYELIMSLDNTPEVRAAAARGASIAQLLQIIQQAKERHRAVPCVPRAVTTARATYGTFVQRAVFRGLTTQAYQHKRIIQQLFVTYSHIHHVTLHFVQPRDSIYSRGRFARTSTALAAQIEQLTQLCKAWCATALPSSAERTLVIYGTFTAAQAVLLQVRESVRRFVYVHTDPFITMHTYAPALLQPHIYNIRHVCLDFTRVEPVEFEIISRLFSAPALFEVLEILGAQWTTTHLTPALLLNLVSHLPRLHALTLRCAFVAFRSRTFAPPNLARTLLAITACTPHFTYLCVSESIGLNESSRTLLEENGTVIEIV